MCVSEDNVVLEGEHRKAMVELEKTPTLDTSICEKLTELREQLDKERCYTQKLEDEVSVLHICEPGIWAL